MAFSEVKKNFGFGAMRLKMRGEEVDLQEFSRMIDAFIAAGFNYFDTAHGYIGGKSELAIGECLSARYRREDFVLANKLSEWYIEKAEDIIPYFEAQLKACRVGYFDFYLCHSVNRKNYEKYKACRAFEIISELKAQGKVRHMAISFHDTADVLDKILSEQPAIEAVQLQINYLDYDDPGVQSRACYDVAVKHGKKVIVMEPVKGGALVNLPKEGAELIESLGGGSPASYALRYAASLPEVFMVLSGMKDLPMVEENVRTMGNFLPLTEREEAALSEVRAIIRRAAQIGCTGCNYCAEVCPKGIKISSIFDVANKVSAAKITRSAAAELMPSEGERAADCIKCGACERVCPQNIGIREKLEEIAEKIK